MRSLSIIFILVFCLNAHAQWEPFSPEGIHANKIRFYVDNYNNWAVGHWDGMEIYNLNTQQWTNYPGMNVSDVAWLNGDSILVARNSEGSYSDGIYSFNPISGNFHVLKWLMYPLFIERDPILEKYFVGSINRLHYSENGFDWQYYSDLPDLRFIDMAIYNEYYLVSQIEDSANLLISSDGGFVWEVVEGAPTISDLHFDLNGKLYGVFPGESWSSGLWSSNDFGLSWDVEFWAININCVGTDPMGNVFVGFGNTNNPEKGIARWDSLNQSLYFMNAGLPNLNINQITYNPGMSAPALFCCTDTGVYINYTYVGLEDNIAPLASVHLWPNPTSECLNIQYSMEGKVSISIYASDGKVIDHFEGPSSKNLKYSCTTLEKGIYIMTIEGDNGILSRKWIKK